MHPQTAPVEVERAHDRDKERLLPEDDPLFRTLGLADADGRLKPTRRDKYRQVEEFLHLGPDAGPNGLSLRWDCGPIARRQS